MSGVERRDETKKMSPEEIQESAHLLYTDARRKIEEITELSKPSSEMFFDQPGKNNDLTYKRAGYSYRVESSNVFGKRYLSVSKENRDGSEGIILRYDDPEMKSADGSDDGPEYYAPLLRLIIAYDKAFNKRNVKSIVHVNTYDALDKTARFIGNL